MGGTVPVSSWAEADAVPYLVYRIDMANVADWCPVRNVLISRHLVGLSNAGEVYIRKQLWLYG